MSTATPIAPISDGAADVPMRGLYRPSVQDVPYHACFVQKTVDLHVLAQIGIMSLVGWGFALRP